MLSNKLSLSKLFQKPNFKCEKYLVFVINFRKNNNISQSIQIQTAEDDFVVDFFYGSILDVFHTSSSNSYSCTWYLNLNKLLLNCSNGRAFTHGVIGFQIDSSFSYFSFQPLCYSASGMVHLKDLLLLIGKNSPYSGGSGFLLLHFEWSFTICLTPYNHK